MWRSSTYRCDACQPGALPAWRPGYKTFGASESIKHAAAL